MAFRDFLRRESPHVAANRHVPAIPPRSARTTRATARTQLEGAREEIAQLKAKEREYEIQIGVLREAVEARDRFLEIAAHELRNPMAAISLAVTGLRFQAERADGALGAAPWLRERLEALERQARYFVRRSTMLLDVNRVAMGQLRVERAPTNLGNVVRESLRELRSELERGRCEVSSRIEDDAVGLWDKAALEQVASNLLSNAVKFGAGHTIDVYVCKDCSVAVLGVRDRGPGIAEADRARIFNPFERAIGGRESAGFGLGLWMARQLVRAHGGEIFVESEPGVGTVFTATFPVTPIAPPEKRSPIQ